MCRFIIRVIETHVPNSPSEPSLFRQSILYHYLSERTLSFFFFLKGVAGSVIIAHSAVVRAACVIVCALGRHQGLVRAKIWGLLLGLRAHAQSLRAWVEDVDH